MQSRDRNYILSDESRPGPLGGHCRRDCVLSIGAASRNMGKSALLMTLGDDPCKHGYIYKKIIHNIVEIIVKIIHDRIRLIFFASK